MCLSALKREREEGREGEREREKERKSEREIELRERQINKSVFFSEPTTTA